MTRKTLEKISGTIYAATLTQKMRDRRQLELAGHTAAADNIRYSIAGYVQALRDTGIITESERIILYIYYGTI